MILSTPSCPKLHLSMFSIFRLFGFWNFSARISRHIFVTTTYIHSTFSIYNYKISYVYIYWKSRLVVCSSIRAERFCRDSLVGEQRLDGALRVGGGFGGCVGDSSNTKCCLERAAARALRVFDINVLFNLANILQLYIEKVGCSSVCGDENVSRKDVTKI